MKNSNPGRLTVNLLFIVFILVLFSCSKEPLEETVIQEFDLIATRNADIIKDQYIVLISKKPVKRDPRAEAALEAVSKEVGNMSGAGIKAKYKNSLTGFVAKMTAEQAKRLEKNPNVLSVTPDFYLPLGNLITSETAVEEYPTWGLDRIDQRDGKLDRVYSYAATGNGVTAYVMDSGVRYSHQEFESRAVSGIDMEFEIDPDGTDPDQVPGTDCHGHGTHVAGTIGGKTFGLARKINIVSVKINPKCENKTPLSYLIGGIDWITNDVEVNQRFPAVVNMSLGTHYDSSQDPLELAIQNSISMGLNYAIAGGNSNIDACDFSPARVPEAITAGASDIYNSRATFSNYGECLDLYAPGVQITSAGIADDSATRIFSGTSMAAPHVAGVVALYLEKNPEATPAEVHAAIVGNATPDVVKEVPSGSASMAHSLWEIIEFTPPPAPPILLEAYLSKVRGKYSISLQWNTPEERSHEVFKNGVLITSFMNGENSYLEYTDEKNATFVYKVCGMAYDNCSQEITVVIGNGGETTEPVNSPPSAGFIYEASLLNVQFTDSSTDSDGTIVSWSWDFGDGNYSNLQNPKHLYALAGTYTVSLQVTDDKGATGNNSKNITVTAEEPAPGNLMLSATGYKVKGQWQTDLAWSSSGTLEQVDLYRNGSYLETLPNTGSYTDKTSFKGGGTLSYQICPPESRDGCSNEVTVQF
jgi:PKD repeat protein